MSTPNDTVLPGPLPHLARYALAAAAAAAALVAARLLIVNAQWRFDIFAADHWPYLGAAIGIWFDGRGPMPWGLLGALFAALATALTIGLICFRMVKRNGLVMRILSGSIRVLSTILRTLLPYRLVLIREQMRHPQGPMVEVVTDDAVLPARPDRREAAREPEAEASAPAPPLRLTVGEAPQDPVSRPHSPLGARQEPATRPRSGLQTEGGEVASETAESPAASSDVDGDVGLEPSPEVGLADDIRATVVSHLRDHGWETLADVFVNADYAGFEGDAFDANPTAMIPLLALAAEEVALISFVDLEEGHWAAAPRDSVDTGLPPWSRTDTGDGERKTLPSPFGMAARALERFERHHGAMLEAAGYPVDGAVMPVVVVTNGSLEDQDLALADWRDAGLIALALDPDDDAADELLSEIFGSPIETPVSPALIAAIRQGSAESRRLLTEVD